MSETVLPIENNRVRAESYDHMFDRFDIAPEFRSPAYFHIELGPDGSFYPIPKTIHIDKLDQEQPTPYHLLSNGAIINKAARIESIVMVNSRAVIEDAVIAKGVVVGREALIASGVQLWPDVEVGDYSEIGQKSILKSDAEVEEHSTVGEFVQLGEYAHVGPNNTIGDNAKLAKGAFLRNGVEVGPFAEIGESTTINPLVKIGQAAILGANVTIDGLADIEEYVEIKDGSKVGRSSKIRFGSLLEKNVVVGWGTIIEPKSTLQARSTVGNQSYIAPYVTVAVGRTIKDRTAVIAPGYKRRVKRGSLN